MLKRSLALLLAAALVAGASAQVSTGILYWCSMEENGANIPAGTNTLGASPRSIYGTFSGSPQRENSACHNALGVSNCRKMTFSNGTVYPNNVVTDNVCNGFTPYDIVPTGCLTADNWGADPFQCKYPGFGRDPLFITNNGVVAPTNYPITYDAKTTCNLAVTEQNLYAAGNPSAIYAKMFAFKDYSDNLYVTVSINASGFMPGQTGPSGGQFLLPNPALPSNNFPTGLAFVGSTFPNGLSILQYAQYSTSQTLDSSVGQYSCFTMMIPLRQACPYETSTFVRGVGGSPSFCASRTTGAAVATIDLSSTVNLFFSAQFNVSKYTTDANSCGTAPTTFVNIGFGNQILDLYGSIPDTQSLSRNCAAITGRPQSPPVPPSPPPPPSPTPLLPARPRPRPAVAPVSSPRTIPPYPPPPSPSPPTSEVFTVVFLNQSSRAYDQHVDCNYLWGVDPTTNAKTFQLLGLYNFGAYSFTCQTQTVTTSTGAIQWSALWMKIFFLDPTLNTLFYNNLATNQGIIWTKIGAIAYPVGLSGAPNVPPPCGFFGMVHTSGPVSVSPAYNPAFPYATQPTSAPFQPVHTSYPAAIMPYYACSANNIYNGNITNPLYFVPPQTASPAAFGIPDGINQFLPTGINSAQPTLTYLPLVECDIITVPNSALAPTGLPPPLNDDSAQFTNLFNQLYSAGVAAEYSTSPLFNFVGPLSTATNTTDYLLIAGTITGPDQWPLFLANYNDSSRMFILAGQFGLTCSDRVWANISGCPGLDDANVAFTGFPNPPGIPTGTGFPNATSVFYNQGIPTCTVSPPPPPPHPGVPSSPPRGHDPPQPHPPPPSPSSPPPPSPFPPPPPPPAGSVSMIVNSPGANCAADSVGLMASIQISVDITQGIQAPLAMVCTDVSGGLVLQISFLLQSDSMAFFDSVTSTPGMTFFIFNARAANSLPCNAIIGVVDSTQRTAQFSCTAIPGQPHPPRPVPTPTPTPVPVPVPTPTPVPSGTVYPSVTTYTMWLSVPSTPPNMNVDVDNVVGTLCPAMNNTIALVLSTFGLDFSKVMKSTQLNGCAVVTPLPNPTGFVRVAYKFYFNLLAADWQQVSAAFDSEGFIREAHVMCDSRIYWQTFTSPAIDTRPPSGPDTEPIWLAQSASDTVCYDDVFAPLH
ncbi:hypothetical protein FOA52_000338 [Chlamydomonas sp. UWO 241]|nr:hypothetical protein FOA52_000338 [Chlamydomonas sp. UWO 241]